MKVAPQKKYQTGSSFIEILVSLSLLSLMLLGLDAMEIISLQESQSDYYFSIAKQQVRVMTEGIHAIKNQTSLNPFILFWNKQNQSSLPKGRGMVTGTYPHYAITIFWGDKTESSCIKNHIGPSGCLTINT